MSDATLVTEPVEDTSPATPPVLPANAGMSRLGRDANSDHDGYHLRVVLTAYWDNNPPSTEVFYVSNHDFRLTTITIASYENYIAELLQENTGTAPLRVIYIGSTGIEMDEEDIIAADWRVIGK